MIITRAPLRITLGGGGTDLPSYYSQYGGFLVAAGINRYSTITANKRFYDNIRLSYSKTEICDSVDAIEHRIFKAALKLTGVSKNIELHSTAEVPSNSGLGSSSSFTVALLQALHTYKGEVINKRELAEEACRIEIDTLGEPIGKQDQYMAAFGGFTCLTFEKNGEVLVEPLRITDESFDQLESNLLFFFTGKERNASEIMKEQDDKSKNNDVAMANNLHQVKEIGLATRKYLENGQIDMLGELLDTHWTIKKQRSDKMSDPFIDECYDVARRHGAIGGKLMGAGGGGFFMFYCKNDEKNKVSEALKKMGLRRERFHVDWDGSRVLLNTEQSINVI